MESPLPQFTVLIAAAGSGARLQNASKPKQYLSIGGKTVLRHTIEKFSPLVSCLSQIRIIINDKDAIAYHNAIYGLDLLSFIAGGKSRKESVYNGLLSLSHLNSEDIVLIHDAARPFVATQDIESVIRAASKYGAASLVSPVVDSLCYANAKDDALSCIGKYVDRNGMYALATPQAFRYGMLLDAHEKYKSEDGLFTDDASLVRALGYHVKMIEGGRDNFKITTATDLELAERLVMSDFETRVGSGFDVHAFDYVPSEAIRLGGIDIPYSSKLKGHSDADVVLHAITDAVLGAIGEGDIGTHFPPSDDQWKGMDSAYFLEKACELLRKRGASLVNMDITIICEEPKIGQYRADIVKRIAEITQLSESRINIKGTTTERLGFAGRKEGIAAQAHVSISCPKD